jgi:hypothetical protein
MTPELARINGQNVVHHMKTKEEEEVKTEALLVIFQSIVTSPSSCSQIQPLFFGGSSSLAGSH